MHLGSGPAAHNTIEDVFHSLFQTDSSVIRSVGVKLEEENTSMAEISSIPDIDDAHEFKISILTCNEAIERLRTYREIHKPKQHFLAMYSSIFGGITTDIEAMLIPMDDHMVHRGHGVFDTAAIVNGRLYEFDEHLDRFLKSALMAKIKAPFDRESIRRILMETARASKCREGSLRYWLSAGPGDFHLSPSACDQPALYAIVIRDHSPPLPPKGVKVITSPIPIKPPQFAATKSVNYLPNVLSKMEAEEKGAFAAIWVDHDGFVAEGPNMNVAFVTKEKFLVVPQSGSILCGLTAKRVLSLAGKLVGQGKLFGIQVCNLTLDVAKSACEMMLIGSGVLVCPVVQWDDHVIGDGKEGPISKALLELILEDMESSPTLVQRDEEDGDRDSKKRERGRSSPINRNYQASCFTCLI